MPFVTDISHFSDKTARSLHSSVTWQFTLISLDNVSAKKTPAKRKAFTKAESHELAPIAVKILSSANNVLLQWHKLKAIPQNISLFDEIVSLTFKSLDKMLKWYELPLYEFEKLLCNYSARLLDLNLNDMVIVYLDWLQSRLWREQGSDDFISLMSTTSITANQLPPFRIKTKHNIELLKILVAYEILVLRYWKGLIKMEDLKNWAEQPDGLLSALAIIEKKEPEFASNQKEIVMKILCSVDAESLFKKGLSIEKSLANDQLFSKVSKLYKSFFLTIQSLEDMLSKISFAIYEHFVHICRKTKHYTDAIIELERLCLLQPTNSGILFWCQIYLACLYAELNQLFEVKMVELNGLSELSKYFIERALKALANLASSTYVSSVGRLLNCIPPNSEWDGIKLSCLIWTLKWDNESVKNELNEFLSVGKCRLEKQMIRPILAYITLQKPDPLLSPKLLSLVSQAATMPNVDPTLLSKIQEISCKISGNSEEAIVKWLELCLSIENATLRKPLDRLISCNFDCRKILTKLATDDGKTVRLRIAVIQSMLKFDEKKSLLAALTLQNARDDIFAILNECFAAIFSTPLYFDIHLADTLTLLKAKCDDPLDAYFVEFCLRLCSKENILSISLPAISYIPQDYHDKCSAIAKYLVVNGYFRKAILLLQLLEGSDCSYLGFIYSNAIVCLVSLNELAEAKEYFGKASKILPSMNKSARNEVYFAQIRLLLLLGDADQCQTIAETIIPSTLFDEAQLLFMKSEIKLIQQELAASLNLAQKSLAIIDHLTSPSTTPIYHGKIKSRYSPELSLDILPLCFDLFLHLGYLYMFHGTFKEAQYFITQGFFLAQPCSPYYLTVFRLALSEIEYRAHFLDESKDRLEPANEDLGLKLEFDLRWHESELFMRREVFDQALDRMLIADVALKKYTADIAEKSSLKKKDESLTDELVTLSDCKKAWINYQLEKAIKCDPKKIQSMKDKKHIFPIHWQLDCMSMYIELMFRSFVEQSCPERYATAISTLVSKTLLSKSSTGAKKALDPLGYLNSLAKSCLELAMKIGVPKQCHAFAHHILKISLYNPAIQRQDLMSIWHVWHAVSFSRSNLLDCFPNALKLMNEQIQPNWNIISISLNPEKTSVILCKMTKSTSNLIWIPLASSKIFAKMKELFMNIIQESIAIVSRNSDGIMKNEDEKMKWWKEREALDKQLQLFLVDLESNLLGYFKTLLMDNYNEEFKHVKELVAKSMIKPSSISSVQIESDFVKALLSSYQLKDDGKTTLLLLQHFHSQLLSRSVARNDIDYSRIQKGLSRSINAAFDDSTIFQDARKCAKEIILILDKDLECFPWESIPSLRRQSVTRIPNMAYLIQKAMKCTYESTRVEKAFYMLNPENDLKNTQQLFEPLVKEQGERWKGFVGCKPNTSDILEGISSSDAFLYFGHGGGEQYVKGSAIRSLPYCGPVFLMGCSSSRLKTYGEFDPCGILYDYLASPCPLIVGNLWDVTDKDIDRFTLKMLTDLGLKKSKSKELSDCQDKTVAEAVMKARDECYLPYLVGAAPVIYGLPQTLRFN